MTRTKKGKRPVGYEYWSKRPGSNSHGAPPGKATKRKTHRLERIQGKKETKEWQMYNLECIPSADKKSVTIEITAQEVIGVQGLIKVLAQFLKHLIATNNISYDEVKLNPSDRATEI